MKKAFTLIELIIVVAIIVIMAVLAVPAFDSYGARNELDGKAQEIKTFIETAYKQAQSPQKGANGTQVAVSNSPSISIASAQMLFDSTCLSSSTFPNCGTVVSSSIVQLPDYFIINNITNGGVAGSGSIMGFKSPASVDSDSCFSTCDPLVSSVSFELVSNHATGESRTITINRYPFNVTVSSP